MNGLRSHFTRWIAAGVLSLFLVVLALESFHHHETSENPNCSLCSWQQNASHAVPATALPHLDVAFRSFTVVPQVESPLPFLAVEIRQGRAPPTSLL